MARTQKSDPSGDEPADEPRPAPKPARAAKGPRRPSAPSPADLEAIGGAIEEALAGVQIVDRALEFDDGARAELAGIDETGRLVLVRLAGEDGDSSALSVLDLIAFVRAHPDLVARHIGAPPVAASLDPRIVVILEPDDRKLAERLGAVAGAGLELYDLRTVKSAAGERAYLVARGGDAAISVDGSGTVQRFLDALPAEKEGLGRELVARLARLDDELRTEATSESVAWFFRDQPLVRLEQKSGRLNGTVGGGGRRHELEAARDADELLEAALARLMEAVGRETADPDAPQGGDPEGELALLSPEEIAAFRD